ncbi:flavin-nucleotide-binding protein [Crassisporium funariophilum]|nr:flavin-nucleotide-binding protein [Crassisporium funariophilum]
MSDIEVYEKTPRSTVNRLKQRAVYDQDQIHTIIDSAPVVHVSFAPSPFDTDPFPAILPMLGCTGAYTSPTATQTSPPAIYLHGHAASRLIKLPTNQGDDFDGLPGVPVCVAATHIDGLVLALTPFNHSCNYRSAIVHGYAQAVTDPAEKMYALTLITDNMLPGRWDNSRVPPTEAEMISTGVLRVDIVSASAKDRADLADGEMRERVWEGVLPAWVTYGEPIPGEENRVHHVPGYIQEWVKAENEKQEAYARRIAVGKPPKK